MGVCGSLKHLRSWLGVSDRGLLSHAPVGVQVRAGRQMCHACRTVVLFAACAVTDCQTLSAATLKAKTSA